MRINKVVMVTSGGEFTFNLNSESSTDDYILTNMEGLDPTIPKYSYNGTGSSKEIVGLLTDEKEELAFRFRLNPKGSNTYGGLRDLMYSSVYGKLDSTVEVRLYFNDELQALTFGDMKIIEASYFTLTPEIILRIERRDIFFEKPKKQINSSDLNLLNGSNSINVLTDNTVPIGLYLEASCFSGGNFPVTLTVNGKTFTIEGYNFDSGDLIMVRSTTQDRFVSLIGPSTNNEEYGLYGYLDPDSKWPIFEYGQNTIHFSPTSKFEVNLIEYTPKYLGV